MSNPTGLGGEVPACPMKCGEWLTCAGGGEGEPEASSKSGTGASAAASRSLACSSPATDDTPMSVGAPEERGPAHPSGLVRPGLVRPVRSTGLVRPVSIDAPVAKPADPWSGPHPSGLVRPGLVRPARSTGLVRPESIDEPMVTLDHSGIRAVAAASRSSATDAVTGGWPTIPSGLLGVRGVI